MRGPIDLLTARLPGRWRIVIDWIVTIAFAITAVFAIKAWVVNPYRIPSSSMEPTLHCADQPGCLANRSDRVLANRFIYHFKDPERGDVIVFSTTVKAREMCGAGGTFVKRIVGIPGDRLVQQRGVLYRNGKRLEEPYLDPQIGEGGDFSPLTVPKDSYFVMGDNRPSSCDSRAWGPLPRENIIGKVFAIYWPPQRIAFR